jgi:hypothetical protein
MPGRLHRLQGSKTTLKKLKIVLEVNQQVIMGERIQLKYQVLPHPTPMITDFLI